MRLRIVSDGTVQGTSVINENNEILENVVELLWQADASADLVMARLLIKEVPVDLIACNETEH